MSVGVLPRGPDRCKGDEVDVMSVAVGYVHRYQIIILAAYYSPRCLDVLLQIIFLIIVFLDVLQRVAGSLSSAIYLMPFQVMPLLQFFGAQRVVVGDVWMEHESLDLEHIREFALPELGSENNLRDGRYLG